MDGPTAVGRNAAFVNNTAFAAPLVLQDVNVATAAAAPNQTAAAMNVSAREYSQTHFCQYQLSARVIQDVNMTSVAATPNATAEAMAVTARELIASLLLLCDLVLQAALYFVVWVLSVMFSCGTTSTVQMTKHRVAKGLDT